MDAQAKIHQEIVNILPIEDEIEDEVDVASLDSAIEKAKQSLAQRLAQVNAGSRAVRQKPSSSPSQEIVKDGDEIVIEVETEQEPEPMRLSILMSYGKSRLDFLMESIPPLRHKTVEKPVRQPASASPIKPLPEYAQHLPIPAYARQFYYNQTSSIDEKSQATPISGAPQIKTSRPNKRHYEQDDIILMSLAKRPRFYVELSSIETESNQ